MAREFDRTGKENMIFLKLYDLFSTPEHPLTMKDFGFELFSFLGEDVPYIQIRRYMFDYWDKDGRCRLRHQPEAHRRLSEKLINAETSRNPQKFFHPEELIGIMTAHPEIAEKIVRVLRDCSLVLDIPEENLEMLYAFARSESYWRLLFSMIKYIFHVKSIRGFQTIETGEYEELRALLRKHHLSMRNLAEYTEHILLRSRQTSSAGMMEILRHAGYPDEINESCDVFTLMEASDIYYYHKLRLSGHGLSELGGSGDPALRFSLYQDRINACKYSLVAYRKCAYPLAAWNLGYTWFLLETEQEKDGAWQMVNDYLMREAPADSGEIRMLTALRYFAEAARTPIGDACNSIGNICWHVLRDPASYPATIEEILRITPPDASAAGETDVERVRICQKYWYREAAKLENVNGMSNYYNLLLKELAEAMTGEWARSLSRVRKDYAETIGAITRYIRTLCRMKVPAALTDYAALSMHKHRINEVIHAAGFTINGEPVTETTPYDFIFPYYKKGNEMQQEKGIADIVNTLNTARTIALQTQWMPWPLYYLAQVYEKDRNDPERARECLREAERLIAEYRYPLTAAQRGKFR